MYEMRREFFSNPNRTGKRRNIFEHDIKHKPDRLLLDQAFRPSLAGVENWLTCVYIYIDSVLLDPGYQLYGLFFANVLAVVNPSVVHGPFVVISWIYI